MPFFKFFQSAVRRSCRRRLSGYKKTKGIPYKIGIYGNFYLFYHKNHHAWLYKCNLSRDNPSIK